MRLLVIENSGSVGSAALVCDGAVEQLRSFASPRGRGTLLFDEMAALAVPAIDRVLVGTGPGGYNGLRASIAAAWGFAQARGIPLLGVSSLLGYDRQDYFALGDARAGEWFVARISGGRIVELPTLLSPAAALQKLTPGVPVFATSPLRGLDQAIVECPRADILAFRTESAGEPLPIYLKPPHITQAKTSVRS